jgi:hypothetical protein
MPCPWHALTMPFFSRPRHSTSVESCPRSASSSYHAEFMSWTRKRVVAAHYKTDDLLNCWTSSSDISGYHADFHQGHGTIGAWQGRGMLCVNRPLLSLTQDNAADLHSLWCVIVHAKGTADFVQPKSVKVNCKLHSQKLCLKRLEKQLTPVAFHSGSPGKSNGRYARLTTHFHLLLRFTYTYPSRTNTALCLPCSCHLLSRTSQLIPHPCSYTGTGSSTMESKSVIATQGKKNFMFC